MLSYDEAKTRVFVVTSIPDGYRGDRRTVGVAIAENGLIIYVTDCGCFRSGLPLAADLDEAIWLLKNHPSSRAGSIFDLTT